jgi:hypothetical protein
MSPAILRDKDVFVGLRRFLSNYKLHIYGAFRRLGKAAGSQKYASNRIFASFFDRPIAYVFLLLLFFPNSNGT